MPQMESIIMSMRHPGELAWRSIAVSEDRLDTHGGGIKCSRPATGARVAHGP